MSVARKSVSVGAPVVYIDKHARHSDAVSQSLGPHFYRLALLAPRSAYDQDDDKLEADAVNKVKMLISADSKPSKESSQHTMMMSAAAPAAP